MTFSIFEGQEASQVIFQVIAPLGHCYFDFAHSHRGLYSLIYRIAGNKIEAWPISLSRMISEAKLNREMGGLSLVKGCAWHFHSDLFNCVWGKCSHPWGGELGACRLCLSPMVGREQTSGVERPSDSLSNEHAAWSTGRCRFFGGALEWCAFPYYLLWTRPWALSYGLAMLGGGHLL